MNLAPAKALIRERLGLRFEGPAEVQLRQAITAQMAALGMADLGHYLARLHTDALAMQALTSLLTIKETYFYRESEHLRLLTEHLAPALMRERPPARPVRILSVGCATGEEPYSIAIALHARWGGRAERLFRISAGDVDPLALVRARAGRYRPFSFRAMPPDLIARWFSEPVQGERLIAESLRRRVAFRPVNLVTDTLDHLGGQDLIFYRNLSIYFDAATRATVLRRLRALLQPHGYLIVGSAETLANDLGELTLVEHDGVWCFANRPAAPLLEWPRPGVARALGRAGVPPARQAPGPPPATPGPGVSKSPLTAPCPGEPTAGLGHCVQIYQEALALARADQVAAALARLAPLCAAADAQPEALILSAHLLLERGDLIGAQTAARRVIAGDPWSVDALVLLGRISRTQGDLDAAVEHLRRAVYQRPDHWPAHFQLAECHRGAGRSDAAKREYRVVLRQLTDPGAAAAPAGPLPSAISLKDVQRLCEARLGRPVGAA